MLTVLASVAIPAWILVTLAGVGLIGLGFGLGSLMERAFGRTGFDTLRDEIVELVGGITNKNDK